MTIRQRLAISFAVLIALFAFNAIVHLWASTQRAGSFAIVQRAMKRQVLLATVKQGLHDLHSQVELLRDLSDEMMAMTPDDEDQEKFKREIDAVTRQMRELHKLCDPADH